MYLYPAYFELHACWLQNYSSHPNDYYSQGTGWKKYIRLMKELLLFPSAEL